jgi:hypothetical protein
MTHDERVTGGTAILRDERDLIWIILDDVRPIGVDLLYDVHFLARSEPNEPPEPFLSTFGHREPRHALNSLLDALGRAVTGEVRALRHDPVGDGLSLEIKADTKSGALGFEITAWLDLVRMNRAMRSRAVRGRHQGGLRFHTTQAYLESFRAELIAFADPSSNGAE